MLPLIYDVSHKNLENYYKHTIFYDIQYEHKVFFFIKFIKK